MFENKRTGVVYDNVRSFVNSVRKSHSEFTNPVMQAFLEHEGLQSAPKCEYCGDRDLKFKSFQHGFYKTCCDGSCVHAHKQRANFERGCRQKTSRVPQFTDEKCPLCGEVICCAMHLKVKLAS